LLAVIQIVYQVANLVLLAVALVVLRRASLASDSRYQVHLKLLE
jgi:hypothetical protein